MSLSRHLSAIFVVFIAYAHYANGELQYSITPSPDDSCLTESQDDCLTLSQLAANSSDYIGNETEVVLLLLPGNHSLDIGLKLTKLDNITIIAKNDSELVVIECTNYTVNFEISNVTFAMISGIHFLGCGDNRITATKDFQVQDTTFQGEEGTGIGLVLYSVTSITIVGSSFFSNTPDINTTLFGNAGGAIYSVSSNVQVIDCTFKQNKADFGGGISARYSNITIRQCTYSNNSATIGGGAIAVTESSVDIGNSTFIDNKAAESGGVVAANFSTLTTHSMSTFTRNSAKFGAVVFSDNVRLDIISSSFTHNNAVSAGGSLYVVYMQSTVTITSSMFSDSTAYYGGVIYSPTTELNITDSSFSNSTAVYGGVASFGRYFIANSGFFDNSAAFGGVLYFVELKIMDSTFTNNRANDSGGFAIVQDLGEFAIVPGESYTIERSNFTNNTAENYGGIMFSTDSSMNISDCTFRNNRGSLYSFNGIITFSGFTTFDSNAEPSKKSDTGQTLQEGGAITSFQSTVTFNGHANLSNNQARQGGAILAIESTIMFYGRTALADNTATGGNGGGISLVQSDLEIFPGFNVTISRNHAVRGGGIHATSSTITVHQEGSLRFVSNVATESGGGLYMEVNPKLYLLKLEPFSKKNLLEFRRNSAHVGGAVYVADNTNSGACSANIECFIQALALYRNPLNRVPQNIAFHDNTALEHGSNVFGGLLDRCIPSPFAEIYQVDQSLGNQSYHGVKYIEEQSNLNTLERDSVSSLPVRVCFCYRNKTYDPNCRYQPRLIEVKKGHTFTVPIVAVDQVNHPVDANISSSLASLDGGFSEGQQSQNVLSVCTDLTFNMFSPHESETINLFADGPCGSSDLSEQQLYIQFLNCTCPIGFQSSDSRSNCECICDRELSPFFTNCDPTTESIIKDNTNAWIMYVNDTDPPGYAIHPNCPFDYCQTQSPNVSINLGTPNGEDAQCANNRAGILCGGCKESYSLSLGSSHCVTCNNHTPAVLVAILLSAIIAGILLVTGLLAFNLTVAVGLVNSFIFYANIVAANSAIFFPSSEPSFPTVFVAWLNLDFGIDVCFVEGLDAYAKTWLQLAFPVYIISLVVLIITVSKYSPRFARLIGKRDPIATLATLILLSYAKLLSTTITALQPAVIEYPDENRTVWLPDGNVKYFQGKHAALAIVAVFIILIGIPYTLLLLFWQWIVRAPKWKIFKWTRNTKLIAFIATYHAPYDKKYRYWTGYLLLIRVILYIVASVAASENPQASILTTIILVGLVVTITQPKLYRNPVVYFIETVMYFNLVAFAGFSLYQFESDDTKQEVVAHASTITTLLLLLGVLAYHIYLLCKKDMKLRKFSFNPYPVQQGHYVPPKVTHSVVELPRPDSKPEYDRDEAVARL